MAKTEQTTTKARVILPFLDFKIDDVVIFEDFKGYADHLDAAPEAVAYAESLVK
jgi:hypothetical protein